MNANPPALRTILVATDRLKRRRAGGADRGRPRQPKRCRAPPDPHLEAGADRQLPVSAVPPVNVLRRLYQADAEVILADAAGALASSGAQIAATHLHCGPPVGSIASLGERSSGQFPLCWEQGDGPLRRLLVSNT